MAKKGTKPERNLQNPTKHRRHKRQPSGTSLKDTAKTRAFAVGIVKQRKDKGD